MTTTIREATTQDVPAIILLLYESDILHWDARPDHFGNPGEPVRVEDYVEHLLEEENGVILVAERENATVGLIQLATFDQQSGPHPRDRPHAKIGDIVVTREHRRSGVGRMLMAAASDWAKARGATEVELTVWDFNSNAKALYESLGYRTTRRTMLRPLD